MVVASFFEKDLCFPDVVVVRRDPLGIIVDSGLVAQSSVQAAPVYFGPLACAFRFVIFLGEDVIDSFHDFSVKIGQQYFFGVSMPFVAHFWSQESQAVSLF